jgi:hypothetical protein
LAAEQFALTSGNGVHIQAKALRAQLLAAMTQGQALQASIETALLFIEQTIKQSFGHL